MPRTTGSDAARKRVKRNDNDRPNNHALRHPNEDILGRRTGGQVWSEQHTQKHGNHREHARPSAWGPIVLVWALTMLDYRDLNDRGPMTWLLLAVCLVSAYWTMGWMLHWANKICDKWDMFVIGLIERWRK